jgi:hypothetical protein
VSLRAAQRRALDAYASEAGAEAVDCRTTEGHKWPGFLDFGHSGHVELIFHHQSREWRVIRWCERDCQVFKWARLDKTTRTLDGRWRIDYSAAPHYLRRSGGTMSKEEKRYLSSKASEAAVGRLLKSESQ